MTGIAISAKKDIVRAITDVHKSLILLSTLEFAMEDDTDDTECMKMGSTDDLERRTRDFGVETDCTMESIESLIEADFKVLKGDQWSQRGSPCIIVTKEQLLGPFAKVSIQGNCK